MPPSIRKRQLICRHPNDAWYSSDMAWPASSSSGWAWSFWYLLPFMILVKMIWRFSQEDVRIARLETIYGIIFLATPHLTSADNDASNLLCGILRYSKSGRAVCTKEDLSALAYSAWEFEKLGLSCPILSCYEKIGLKVRVFAVSCSVTVSYWAYVLHFSHDLKRWLMKKRSICLRQTKQL